MDGLEMLCVMVIALFAFILVGLAIGALFAAIMAPIALVMSWIF